ncbi:P-loop containing nucleoside triphosphate hydrolase protein [Pholiota molesta]|nr:P-loop containing nucleoside triphosphate hydrolase protein [Pholiota molesta]
MLADIAAIAAIRPLLLAALALHLLDALVPAVHLACSARLLDILQTAVDHRTVDTHLLVSTMLGIVLSSAAKHFLRHLKIAVQNPLHRRIRSYYSLHIFAAVVRLDVPTYDDPAVQRQLEQSFNTPHSTVAYQAIAVALRVLSTAIQLLSQLSVLYAVLRNHPDAPLLILLCCTTAFFQWNKAHNDFARDGVWVATTADKDYIKAEGLKATVSDPDHRKEIVAEYRDAVARLGDRTGDFFELMLEDRRNRTSFASGILFQEFLRALPQVVFALRAVQKPASIPLSLASLNLITTTTEAFTYKAFALLDETGSISGRLLAVRQLYQLATIPNRVKVHPRDDDTNTDEALLGTPFPRTTNPCPWHQRRPAYALRNVSFKIERGQLCVIVGNNGSGKSTILKLIARLYDPIEGTILIDGIDIKTLRLADLRRAITVLFQDYTHFPLSIHDNIALGDPAHAEDRAKVERAAQLGGADAFITRLPEAYDTYLEPPVRDYYSAMPEGMHEDGRVVDFTAVRAAAGIAQTQSEGGATGGVGSRGLSGGQMQRIALSRTFMRSVVSDQSVGLLLFDEPSASLDPTAEHDLFERLRKLRGNKTMVFSSHRFGNLTRHADRILGHARPAHCRGGEYARIWMLQARAFL